MNNFIRGFKDFGRAHQLFFHKGLWTVFVIPCFLSLLYFPVSIFLAVMFMDDAADYIHQNWLPESLQGLATMILLNILLWTIGIYLAFLLFRNVIMILYSPILAHLSEKTENRQRDKEDEKFDWTEVAHSAARGTSMSLLSLALAVLAFVLSWALSLLPILGGIIGLLLMTLSQFFLAGLGFCDPPLERRKKTIRQTFTHAWQHRGRTLGHGTAFTLLLLIPLAGWFLAPSYGIVAGTLGVMDQEENNA